ncbi:hypothetical protein AX16_000294 [Volvariella volvacea WC 439]|nr:hypothetical protein AX16_000294 [Volvariella volvacea WC 439]
MMNRRLRERLTEAEILQIFVDVCEGVAYMHNLRPPLLHRDLKVENILQASPTSYKLCDFGSATTVAPRPPSTTQEIRALEADLGRHTTLQYRAPEMVDPYLRRPVDEKSDVWALGVLLYKLCYYTTPFEEHGPLAILNVQYRIPPYPVYSPQMNALIASMLREYGTQRPTVFEILNHVHHLRGTKSNFKYNMPTPQPLSPRQQRPQVRAPTSEPAVQYLHSGQPLAPVAGESALAKGQGVQAREKVLEAIAPMRRGRPTSSNSHALGPQNSTESLATLDRRKSWLESGFSAEGDQTWGTATSRESVSSKPAKSSDDAWSVPPSGSETRVDKSRAQGFADNFGDKVWVATPPPTVPPPKTSPQPPTLNADNIKLSASPAIRTAAYTGPDALRLGPVSSGRPKERDAFEGLGLTSAETKPAPTLAEARKLRTGLAMINSNPQQANMSRPEPDRQNSFQSRPSLSSRSSYLPQPQSKPSTPVPPVAIPSTQRLTHQISRTATSQNTDGLPVESRFPSLAELDASFSNSSSSQSPAPPHPELDLYPSYMNQSNPGQRRSMNLPNKVTASVAQNDTHLKSASPIPPYVRSLESTKSEQVTGGSIKDSRLGQGFQDSILSGSSSLARKSTESQDGKGSITSRPISRRPPLSSEEETSSWSSQNQSPSLLGSAPHPNAKLSIPSSSKTTDWPTGDISPDGSAAPPSYSSASTTTRPVVRDAPSKRASVIKGSSIQIPEASTVQRGIVQQRTASPTPPAYNELSPTISKFTRTFPPVDLGGPESAPESSRARVQKGAITEPQSVSAISSEDEGPEDAAGLKIASSAKGSISKRTPARQGSVNDLVDLWDGNHITPRDSKEKERETAPTRPLTDTTFASTSLASQWSMQKEPGTSSLVAPTTKSDYQRPPSPRSLIPPEAESSHRRSASRERNERQPSPAPSVASPITGRSRPQSMFTFPSKQPENAAISSGLVPPEGSKPKHNLRRTSISDMVQMYEAMESKARSTSIGPTPPSPSVPRSPLFKSPMTSDGPRAGRNVPETERLNISSNNLPVPGPPSPSGSKPQGSPTIPRASPVIRTSPLILPSELPKDSETSPQSRSSSFRPDANKLSFPLRKVTLEEPPRPTVADTRAPSPERPYQGVGKLIDQWQRKTAEAEAQNTSPRKPVPKRTLGVAQGSSRNS